MLPSSFIELLNIILSKVATLRTIDDRSISHFIPASIRENEDAYFRARNLILGTRAITALMFVGMIARYYLVGMPAPFFAISFSATVLFAVAPYVLQFTSSLLWATIPTLLGIAFFAWAAAAYNNGIFAAGVVIFVMLPAIGMLFAGKTAAHFSMAITFVSLFVIARMTVNGFINTPDILYNLGRIWLHATILLTVTVLTYGISLAFEWSRQISAASALERHRLTALSILASGMAHEINNPLTVIQGLTSLNDLKNKSQSEPDEQLLDSHKRIMEMTNRIGRVTRDLLAYASNTDGDYHTKKASNLSNIIAHVTSELSTTANSHNAQVSLITPIPVDLQVNGPEHLIKAVVETLVANAIEATIQTDIKRVTIAMEQSTQHHVLLTISDSGLGIKPEHQKHLMTPFFTTKHPGQGTGMSLAIAHRIMNDCGGRIYLDTNRQDTTFVLEMLRRPDAPPL